MREQYLWKIFVFSGPNQTPIQTVEVTGNRSAIAHYAHWIREGDRYEAIPQPLECITNKECQYDYLAFEAMKISGEIKKIKSLS